LRIIGLISGTSIDGIEAAVGDFWLESGVLMLRPLGHRSLPYEAGLRKEILATLPPAATTMEQVARLHNLIGQAFAGAADTVNSEFAGGRAELVVSHGQNAFHWVEGRRARGTLQLGQPAWIAERTGLPVVSDVRARDIAAGGQGAPLVSLFDSMLFGGEVRRALLNLGGIANITVVGDGRPPLAFDTGPANALMDAVVYSRTGGAEDFDRDGRHAAAGVIDQHLLAELLAEPYFSLDPPKSTGRELFSLAYIEERLPAGLGLDDTLATLAALTAQSVAKACLAQSVSEVVAAGGGTFNPTLMKMLASALGKIPIRSIDEWGIPPAAKEAYAFALLGFMTAHNWPGVAAGATGADHVSILGSITPGRRGWSPIAVEGAPPSRLRVVTG
jgi:anhydro-N-acetylmuramic acid kinase